ncbi:MAG: glycosyltransferase [Bacteroidales bacterium]|nr:glycosyltransferase [Bacteroidales bacterium]
MNKILTIVIPSYNMEKYLDRCLSSLIVDNDLMDRFEALIVNDGSKDRTSEIAHGYEARFPGTFRVIDKENGHYGSCVNAGLAEAEGDYIKILDADDFFAAGFSDYLSFLEKTDADLVLTESISVDEDGNMLSKTSFHLPPNETAVVNLLNDSGIKHLDHFNITWRTSLLKEMGYRQTQGISYTDLEWSTLPSSRIASVAYCPATVYCYLRGRIGQSVDIGYRKNNMWMENQVVLGIARRYESINECMLPGNALLFKNLTAFLIQQVYFHYLVNFPHSLDEAELVSFDKSLLETSKTLYDAVSDARDVRKFGTFHYIRDFRKKGTRKTLKYAFVDACIAIGSIFRKH